MVAKQADQWVDKGLSQRSSDDRWWYIDAPIISFTTSKDNIYAQQKEETVDAVGRIITALGRTGVQDW